MMTMDSEVTHHIIVGIVISADNANELLGTDFHKGPNTIYHPDSLFLMYG